MEVKVIKIFSIFGYICLLLLASAGFLELSARFFYSSSESAPWNFNLAHRRPEPYTMFGPKIFDLPANSKKEKGEFRVFSLGGSTLVNGRVPLPLLVEDRLKGLVSPGINKINVYNFGVVSQNSTQELIRLLHRVVDLQPDLVFFYDGGNDILDPISNDPRPGFPFNFMIYENNPLLDPDLANYPTLEMCGLGSRYARKFFSSYYKDRYFKVEELRKRTHYLSESWLSDIAKIYVGNLVKAHKVSQAFGAKFIVFFQPTIFYKKALSTEEQGILNQANFSDVVRRYREYVRAQIKSLPLEEKINFVDLSEIYDFTPETAFTDEIHTNDKAREPIAEQIFRHISSMIRVKK